MRQACLVVVCGFLCELRSCHVCSGQMCISKADCGGSTVVHNAFVECLSNPCILRCDLLRNYGNEGQVFFLVLLICLDLLQTALENIARQTDL